MAEFPPIKGYVERAVRLALGNPIMAVCEKEKQIIEDAEINGLMDYYRLCPYIVRKFYSVQGVQNSTFSISFQEVIDQLPDNIRPYAHYLGILRDDITVGLSYQGLYSFDNYLLGTTLVNPLSSFSASGTIYSRTDFPLKQLAYGTINDLVSGEPVYNIDRVNKTVNFILPVTIGQLSVDHAVGFTCWDIVEMAHADLVAKYVCKHVLESIITSRTNVKLNADYSIDVSALQSQLEDIKKYLQENQTRYRRVPLIWG